MATEKVRAALDGGGIGDRLCDFLAGDTLADKACEERCGREGKLGTQQGPAMLRTARLNLRPWGEHHRAAFAALHADPEVMADLGVPVCRRDSDAKLDRYLDAFRQGGVSRWAVEDREGAFLGYAGVMPRPDAGHPLGPHHEVGWRLVRAAWGQGYAAESARAALDHAFRLLGVSEILSYTSGANHRSQAVMGRLGLVRSPSRDFTAEYPGTGRWTGLVWTASRP